MTRGAAVALCGGLVNLFCDVLFVPGGGAGELLSTPAAVATVLARTPLTRIAVATVVGALAIGTWNLATPALARIVRPAGPRLEATVAVLHVSFISACIAFHVGTGCLGWVGHVAPRAVARPEVLDPFWTLLHAATGTILLALAAALGLAAWRGRPHVPVLLPFVSPIIAFSVFAIPAQLVPAPYGLSLAMVSSTAGGLVWLGCLWAWSRPTGRRL